MVPCFWTVRESLACREFEHVHATVDQRLSTPLRPLLTSSGFDCSGVEYDRDGPGRNEVIFRWNQDGPYCNHLDPAVLRGRDLPAREALRISGCVVAKFQTGDRMVVYATAPLSLLVGEFRVGRILTGTPEEVCAEKRAPTPSAHTRFPICAVPASCTAIEIIAPRRWAAPMSLARLRPAIRAPQSYVFIKENDGLLRDH